MDPVTRRRWQARTAVEPAVVRELAGGLGLQSLTARVLAQRGCQDLAQARAFLDGRLASLPDPGLLSGMTVAVQRLIQALTGGEKILVHGDYDVDGISGTALLVETLRACGGQAESYIPLRLSDGYGLSGPALEQAAAQGFRLVVSVDCGISALAEAQLAAQLGLDLIITDHHQPPAELPSAVALINPQLPDSAFPARDLAGVGVAFFLLVALRKGLREAGWFDERPEPDLRTGLDLVALGTIADVVPLQGVNRTLVMHGLRLLAEGRRPGARALRTVSGVKQLSCGSVAFQLAPRLNAAGRLEDAALGVELLLCDDQERAAELAATLDAFNRERQQLEQAALRQAEERLRELDENRQSIVLADERWHPGVIGIVASRLVERYHRPSVLIALDGAAGKGSARSIRGIHLYQSLADCAELLQGYGGHAMAAGLSLDAGQVDAFAEAFEAVVAGQLDAQQRLPQLSHDGEVLLEELSLELVRELDGLAPFGMGNPEPAFIARGVSPQQLRVVGTNHLQLTLRQDGYSVPAIGFGLAERQDELGGPLDILFTPSCNHWRGRDQLQLRLRDVRPAGTDYTEGGEGTS